MCCNSADLAVACKMLTTRVSRGGRCFAVLFLHCCMCVTDTFWNFLLLNLHKSQWAWKNNISFTRAGIVLNTVLLGARFKLSCSIAAFFCTKHMQCTKVRVGSVLVWQPYQILLISSHFNEHMSAFDVLYCNASYLTSMLVYIFVVTKLWR